jgi:hypothetical protein
MQNQHRRNMLGIGSLDEIDVLLQILFYPEADEVDSGGPQLGEGGILLGRAELQRVNKVETTNDILRVRRARPL